MKVHRYLTAWLGVIFCLPGVAAGAPQAEAPRIVNIINFIRQTEPRSQEITDEVLYDTVVKQVEQLNQHQLPGTFLLQYDALINPKYQALLKEKLSPGSEVGAWWEITQPHVEAAGLKWRGRYPWDWHANIGFSTGYTPQEREKLVDVYMAKFKSIFGRFPESVGSWFIDEHTLRYMYEKYAIVASCNCKDQIGTDGYTLWGGYWNQAYYPSKKNSYMPAQTASGQIPVPVFRMLGSDPVHQYENGLGGKYQGVISLEPVYGDSGGNRKWIEWFFKVMFDDPALGFNYAQAGQENSFTWAAMEKGLNIQMPILAELKTQNKIRVETLATSGKWFKKNYQVTPPTALSALSDVREEGNKTVWFNSRYYRANLHWHQKAFRFRDIHLFDEKLVSDYLTKAGTSNQCIYKALPLVDGFSWGTPQERAGLRLRQQDGTGQSREILLNDPEVTSDGKNALQVKCATDSGDIFTMTFHEDRFEVSCKPKEKDTVWHLALTVAESKKTILPFTTLTGSKIKGTFNQFDYGIECKQGRVGQAPDAVFVIQPSKNKIVVDCSRR